MDGNTTLGLILGKAPHRSPVLSEVIATLRDEGIPVEVHVQDRDLVLPVWLPDVRAVALRGLSAPMLRTLEFAGGARTRFIDTPAGLLSVRDRAWVHDRLAGNGVMVPAYRRVMSWSGVMEGAAERPVVVKAVSGVVGRGRQVLASRDGPLPARAPFPGPYLFEELAERVAAALELSMCGIDVLDGPRGATVVGWSS